MTKRECAWTVESLRATEAAQIVSIRSGEAKEEIKAREAAMGEQSSVVTYYW